MQSVLNMISEIKTCICHLYWAFLAGSIILPFLKLCGVIRNHSWADVTLPFDVLVMLGIIYYIVAYCFLGENEEEPAGT